MDINRINKAIALTDAGKYDEAEAIYTELLAGNSDNASLLAAVGLFYINKQDYAKAINHLTKAWEIKKTAGTISAIGLAHFELKNYEAAADWLEKALEYGDSASVYDKLILSLFNIKNYKSAIKYSQIMYEKYPQNPNAVANKVKSLTKSGKAQDAEKLCVDYLQTNPECPTLWIHLGFLKELIYGDDKIACECFKTASELGHTEADYNIAVSYQKQGDYKNAEIYYQKMLEKFPNDKTTKTSYGMCLLKQKKFSEGYKLFFEREESVSDRVTLNKWKPNTKFDKELLIISDQGYGDNIQFARYLPFIKQKTEKLSYAVRSSLLELFKDNFPYINFIKLEEINPNMQSIKITDLAYALNMDFNNIPAKEGYLKAEIADIKSDKPKIGLCWEAGSAGIRTMINRTIHVNLLDPLFKLKNIQLYSFQFDDTLEGCKKYPQMINLAKDFKNFKDTAEAINAMDIIISVDTALAHLAGALGKKTFLLLPYASDWRWFDDTKTTPWYDSVEIIKQTDPISWEKPIEEIICKLKEYCS